MNQFEGMPKEEAPEKAPDTVSERGEDMAQLINPEETARKLGISTEGKTKEQIQDEVDKKIAELTG